MPFPVNNPYRQLVSSGIMGPKIIICINQTTETTLLRVSKDMMMASDSRKASVMISLDISFISCPADHGAMIRDMLLQLNCMVLFEDVFLPVVRTEASVFLQSIKGYLKVQV